MTKSACPIPEHISLNYHLFHRAKCPDDLRHLLIDISRAAKYISHAIQTTDTGLTKTTNTFGEEQLKLDVLSDRIIHQHLCESEIVASFASEEHGELIELTAKAPYTVVFDPLDGSSLVDTNFAIGSIFGVYEGKDVIGKCPREQVAVLYVLYGPRTVLVYCTGNGVHEFMLNSVGEFVLLREYLGVGDDAKNFSPGNLRAVTDTASYHDLMNQWMDEALTLRYSGCMAADVHHILSKGQGVFTNIGGNKYPQGKLRLVFECGPFAYLIEQAGGASSDGRNSLLDKKITSLDQRTPIIVGSKNEVERCCKVLAGK
ncbi:fructose-1,6-bisphosphatase [Candidatus Peregrinibacteria bacterium]|nr:fructose-1,6-bisphosphatase [Candidatus Peregrinibacteria bacterium]